MATTSQDQPQDQAQQPKFTCIDRVAQIPLVASTMKGIHNVLEGHLLTRSPYHVAQALGHTAYSYSQPLQVRLRTFIVSVDGYANRSLDIVEEKCPYPFKASPEDVASYMRQRRDSVMSSANETFDKTVKTPVVEVAEGIDKKFTPIVDYFEIAVNKVGNEHGAAAAPESQYQYQRALALSKHLKDNFYVYSAEHLKQLQEHSVLVQKAMDTATSIQTLASRSLTDASTRVRDLSDSMLQEMQRVQQSAATLPQTLQSALPDISQNVKELSDIWTAPDTTLGQKVDRSLQEVKDHAKPTLEKMWQRVGDLANAIGIKKEQAAAGTQHNENGHAAQ